MKIVGMKISGALIGLLLVAPASAGTNPNAKGSGAVVDSTMVWNGITRYYEVYLPPHLPANPPMVFMLHGTSHEVPPANPSTDMWGWQSVSNKHGFILVKPASTYNPQSGQWNWDAYTMDAAFQSPPDDSGFLRNLIVTLTGRYNVNPNQVYVAGFSSGAQMAHRVGVEISDLVAAIAIGSGRFLLVSIHAPRGGRDQGAYAQLARRERRRGARAGLRSGAGRHAGSHDAAMQQRHHEVLRPQVSPGHRGPVFQLLDSAECLHRVPES